MSNPTATKRLALVAEPKIEEGKKLAWLEFVEKAEGGNLKVRAGVPSEFAKTLKVGDKGDAVLETIPGANGRDNWVKLQTWNGQPTEPQRQGFKGGGGGGGFKGPQRTPEQEASIMAQVAAKEASVMVPPAAGGEPMRPHLTDALLPDAQTRTPEPEESGAGVILIGCIAVVFWVGIVLGLVLARAL